MSSITPLIAYLASIPRPVLLIVALALFGTAARWRFRWHHVIDLALIALAVERMTIGMAAWTTALIALRHVPAFAQDIAQLIDLEHYDGLTQRLGWLLLPGAAPHADHYVAITEELPVRADDRTGADGGSAGSPDPVLPHQYQFEPVVPPVCEPAPAPAALHRMSRAEEIAMLTVQRNEDGSYRHSANKIAELMGGTAADVKGQVAAIRGPAKPAQPPAAPRVDRPVNGWGK